jgi:hypothetical protein
VAFDKNKLKSTHTLAKYRTGYRTAWNEPKVEKYMTNYTTLKPPGSYNPNNQQGGVMFAVPREVNLDGKQAGIIMRLCYKARMSLSQLESVRKMLSFAYQLTINKKDKTNYDEVAEQWGCQDPELYGEPTQKILAEVSVEPSGLKKAFTTEYNPRKGMPFMQWCVGLLVTHDYDVCGARSYVDLHKIKQSGKHIVVPSEGWMCTAMKGGRAKLEKKKGTRPWSCYRVCLCPGGKHKCMPKHWEQNLDQWSNPKKITWCTTCPLNAFEVLRTMLAPEDQRIYPRWLPDQNRFSKADLGQEKMMKLHQNWLNYQGANPDGLFFDSNSGRKSLGKWCDEFNIVYHMSFEIHGDLWKTWKKHYQHGLQKDPCFERRTQSNNPDLCCAALRRFARAIGRGRTIRDDPKEKLTMQQHGQMMAALLRRLGEAETVAKIMDGH